MTVNWPIVYFMWTIQDQTHYLPFVTHRLSYFLRLKTLYWSPYTTSCTLSTNIERSIVHKSEALNLFLKAYDSHDVLFVRSSEPHKHLIVIHLVCKSKYDHDLITHISYHKIIILCSDKIGSFRPSERNQAFLNLNAEQRPHSRHAL